MTRYQTWGVRNLVRNEGWGLLTDIAGFLLKLVSADQGQSPSFGPGGGGSVEPDWLCPCQLGSFEIPLGKFHEEPNVVEHQLK